MILEVEEEQEKHDVWGTYIRIALSDKADFNKEKAKVKNIIEKYLRRSALIKKDGKEVERVSR